MNLPNKLTLLRVGLVPVYLVLLWASQGMTALAWAALLVFCVAAVTDFFDGQIARKYNLITNFGKFMDPIADKLLTHTAFIMLTAMGRLSVWACIIFIAREFVVSGIRLVAVEQGQVIAAGMSGKVKTVLQMISVILLNLVCARVDGIALLAQVVTWAAVLMTLYSMVEYVWQNRKVLQ